MDAWADKIGADSFMGLHSYAPTSETLDSIASSIFGFELEFVPTTILAIKEDNQWKIILNKDDLYNGPLANKKLEEICTTGTH